MQMLLFTEEIASVGPQSHFQANWSHRAELKCIHCSDFKLCVWERENFEAKKKFETIGTLFASDGIFQEKDLGTSPSPPQNDETLL